MKLSKIEAVTGERRGGGRHQDRHPPQARGRRVQRRERGQGRDQEVLQLCRHGRHPQRKQDQSAQAGLAHGPQGTEIFVE